jgi:GAF domain-containing protein
MSQEAATMDKQGPRRRQPASEVATALFAVLSEVGTLDEQLERVLGAVAGSLGWDAAACWELDAASHQLRCESTWSAGPMERFVAAVRATLLPPGVGLSGRVWESQGPVWAEDLAAEANFPLIRPAAAVGLRSAAAFPVVVQDGGISLVIECYSEATRPPDDQVLAAMERAGSVIGTFLERREADEERRELFEAVQAERARLKAVLRQLPLGVVITGPDDEVVLANDAVGHLLGPPGADGRYRMHRPDDNPAAARPLPGALRDERGVVVTDEEVDIRTPAGDVASVSINAVPVYDAHGRAVSGVTTIVDVTHQRAEQARTQLLAEAGDMLTRSLEVDETLEAIVEVSTSGFADVCIAYFPQPDPRTHHAVSSNVEQSKHDLVELLLERYEPVPVGGGGAASVLATGEAMALAEVDEDLLASVVVDPDQLALLRKIGLRSVIVAPIKGRGRTLGALVFLSVTPEKRFDDADVRLAVDLGHRTGLAISNAQLYERSREVANTLQASLLPPRLPDAPGLELGTRFLAGGEGVFVGGDFYDLFALDDHRWAILVGDVCGKGVEAATVAARVRHTVRVVPEQPSPPALLKRVNEVLCAEPDNDLRFCTLVYGVLDVGPQGVSVTMAAAGHPSPLVVRADGAIVEVPCRGTLLGVYDDVRHTAAEVALGAGDALVAFTDGVIEARRGDQFFGDEGVRAALGATAGHTAPQMADALVDAVQAHTHSAPTDDVAVLVVRVPPVAPQP